MEYVYIRIDPDEKIDSRQLDNLHIPDKNRFVDHCQPKKIPPPQLQRLINTIQNGDIVHIQSVEHLATSSQALHSIACSFFIRGALLHFHVDGVILFSEDGLKLLYQFPRENRSSTYSEDQKEKVKEIFRQDISRKVRDVSKETGVSIAMCYYLRKQIKA